MKYTFWQFLHKNCSINSTTHSVFIATKQHTTLNNGPRIMYRVSDFLYEKPQTNIMSHSTESELTASQ